MSRKLSIVAGSATSLDQDGEEISTFLGKGSIISGEQILGDDEDSVISLVDKKLKKSKKQKVWVETTSDELVLAISHPVSDTDFEKNFHDTYSKKYPNLFVNGVSKAELFDEEHLGIITSKKTTKVQIRDILNKQMI